MFSAAECTPTDAVSCPEGTTCSPGTEGYTCETSSTTTGKDDAFAAARVRVGRGIANGSGVTDVLLNKIFSVVIILVVFLFRLATLLTHVGLHHHQYNMQHSTLQPVVSRYQVASKRLRKTVVTCGPCSSNLTIRGLFV